MFRRKASVPWERLTVRILADVYDVDPLVQDDVTATPVVQMVEKPFIAGVAVQLCLEGDGVLQWLTEADVAGWGVQQDELFSSAIKNLDSKVPSSKLNKITSDHGEVYTPICDGVMPTSMILSDQLLSDFGFVKEHVAAVLPNRDTYYFCNKDLRGNLELLKLVGGIAWDNEYCPKKHRITKHVLVAEQQAAFGWAPLQQQN